MEQVIKITFTDGEEEWYRRIETSRLSSDGKVYVIEFQDGTSLHIMANTIRKIRMYED